MLSKSQLEKFRGEKKIRLLEYESKEIFDQCGIPTPNYVVINDVNEIKKKAKNFSYPAIIKSQIAISSRKKAGLIKIAQSEEEAINLCQEFFSIKVENFRVKAIIIEELLKIEHEYYCSITLDASGRQFSIIGSKEGGIDIEEIVKTNPKAITKVNFSIREGLTDEISQKVALRLGFSTKNLDPLMVIFKKLWEIMLTLEAELVEINPLVLTPLGLIAVDAKIIIDDNAIFRHPNIQKIQSKKLSDLEKLAKEAGFSFVELEGDIGILANGAGLTMALLDMLSELGLKPGNFLDVGGGASKERVYKALELIFELKPKCILINIFGGITRCDIVAEAIIQALKNFKDTPPIVIRLTGTNEIEGMSLLKREGIFAYKDVIEAVNKVKEVVKQ